MLWLKKRKTIKYKKPKITKARKHYLENKEKARKIVLEKIVFWNSYYNYKIRQVRIKMVKTRWGSCSSKGNLNFNYKIMFLPERLQDYIVVHELCHLEELNHSRNFWQLVEKTLPEYKEHIKELREMRILVK